MPEGPETRIVADKLASALTDAPVVEVFFAFDRLKRFQDLLEGRQVRGVEARGKALLTHFDDQLIIYSHNQLYGRWQIRKSYDYPQTNRQLRMAIHTEQRSAMLYSASDIDVLTSMQVAAHPYLSALGPDVLASDSGELLGQLVSARFQKRRLSSLLLDQRFVAGIGNYLRSEILFVAGLHPRLRPVDCGIQALEHLAKVAVAVSRQSYRHRGVTNDLADARALQAQGQTRTQYRHWVFGRGGQACRRCGARIARELAASRRIYFCPVCQPLS